MSSKEMEEYKLYVMTSKGWKAALMRPIEKKIEAVLVTSTIVENSDIFGRMVLDSSTHILETLKMDVHRCCSIVYCKQTNKATKGQRYIVYGIPYNMDCDRGIGTTMGYFDPTNTLEYCPDNLHRDHIVL
jgi:hypothetical protein